MVFVIDADGVIVNLLNPWIEKYNECFNDNIKSEDIKEYDSLYKITKQNKNVIDDILCQPGFFEKLPAIPGAIDTVNKLIDLGHQVLVVTSYSDNEEIAYGKVVWFQKHLPQVIKTNGFILCPAKSKMYVNCDIFIDDSFDNVKSHDLVAGNPFNILINAPYNINENWKYRMDSLKDIFTFMSEKGVVYE